MMSFYFLSNTLSTKQRLELDTNVDEEVDILLNRSFTIHEIDQFTNKLKKQESLWP